jgi:hypothetical protein
MRPVAMDTLLLHHKAYVMEGAGLKEAALDVGYKGGLE